MKGERGSGFKEEGRQLGDPEGGETVVRMHCMRKTIFKKKKKEEKRDKPQNSQWNILQCVVIQINCL